jgi:DNA-binding NarL/FixJ family response regulator
MDRDDDQRQQRIRQLYEQQGWNCTRIAREVGLSRQRVFQIKQLLGLRKPNEMPPADRQARIAELMREGKSRRDIAQMLGISMDRVAKDLARNPQRGALLKAHRAAQPTAQRRAQVPALIAAGKTAPEIAKVLGASTSMIVNDFARIELSPALKAKVHENAKAARMAGMAARNRARAAAGRSESR